jgi:hypothetical protein
MHILRFPPLLVFLCLSPFLFSQHISSRVTFPIDDKQTLSDLAKAGIDLTHGHGTLRTAFTTELHDFELQRLSDMGIRFTIDIPDVSQLRKISNPNSRGGGFLDCQDHSFDGNVPDNFELGQKGGFFSHPEFLDHLDAMAIAYPHLISTRTPIGNFKTWNNNQLVWVKISDNPDSDEAEPEILYTGLHHGKELISVSQMIYYMWYLLENYDKDPLVKQIIDHTELYFVPVVNPDAMNYNIEGYDPDDDVFTRNWRKNMRDNNGNGEFEPNLDGVDLNRNYGENWGYDNEGSSPFMGSDTYRGPAPFSEPEIQAIAHFCQEREFQLALNYHSYGNVLIYPWGYNNTHTPDSNVFSNFAELLTQRNGYLDGLGIETVGYITNGDSDDWMYAETGIFAMTPEVGDVDDGFYPPGERIIPLCQSTLDLNLVAARLINSLIRITDETPDFIEAGVNTWELEFNRYGLLDGEVLISFHPLSPYVTQVPDPIHLNLNKFEPHTRQLSLVVSHDIPYGEEVEIEIVCQQGQYTFRDTISKTRADFSTVLTANGNMEQWDISGGTGWGNTMEEYKSGPVSITDSPLGMYIPNAEEAIVLDQDIDLTKATSAYAQFWAQWDIEDHFDYVVFQASTDGENWENLCGEQSRLGSIFQLYEEPLYDGKQDQWVLENTDLSQYTGQLIRLRFLLVSDGFEHKDGFYFDDFKVVVVHDEKVSTSHPIAADLLITPNPARDQIRVQLPTPIDGTLVVYNALGQPVYRSRELSGSSHLISSQAWAPGLYSVILLSGQQPVNSSLLSISR